MRRVHMHFWDEHKTITRYYEMKVSGVCEKYQLRQLENDILMFIYNNPAYNTARTLFVFVSLESLMFRLHLKYQKVVVVLRKESTKTIKSM